MGGVSDSDPNQPEHLPEIPEENEDEIEEDLESVDIEPTRI